MNYEEYKDEEIVRILNPLQAGLYIKHKIKPIDVIYTDCLVFIFERNKTKELYKLWMKRKLK